MKKNDPIMHDASKVNDETGYVSVPDAWVFVRIGDVSIKGEQRSPLSDEEFIYVDIGSIDRDSKKILIPQRLTGMNAPSRARKVINTGDIIVSLTRPNLNAVAFVQEEFDNQIASTGFEVIKPVCMANKYLYYLVRSELFVNAISRKVQGALYPAAKSSDVRAYRFPLPPIAEQREIVARLDEQLGQVESLQKRLDAIPELLKRFRQTTLTAAVSGKLTEEWRINASLNDHPWENVPVSNFVQRIEAGKSYKCIEKAPTGNERGIVKISAVTWGVFDENSSKTLPQQSMFIENRQIKEGDFLISRANTLELLGTPIIVQKITKKLMLSDKVLRLVLPDEAKPWLNIFFRSYMGRKQIESRATGNQESMRNISQKALLGIYMPRPTKKEQLEIARRVDDFSSLADQIEARVNEVRERVSGLSQSILTKAFTGELTADWREANPDLISGGNSAAILLERIKIARSTIPKPKPRKTTNNRGRSSKGLKSMKTLIEVLHTQDDWVSAQEAFSLAGIADGSDTDAIERLYEELRKNLDRIKIERRGDEDWLRLNQTTKRS